MFSRISIWRLFFVCLLTASTAFAAEYGSLSAKESQSYQKGIQTLRQDAKDDQILHLNLGETWQYETVINHLKLRGKTPANAPQLFRFLKAEQVRARKAGETMGYKTAFNKSAEDAPQPMHNIETSALVEENQAIFNASSSFPEGTTYTYLDVTFSSSDPTEGDVPALVEEFGGGTNVVVQGNVPVNPENLSKNETERQISSLAIAARDINGNGSLEENEYLSVTYLSGAVLRIIPHFGIDIQDPVDRTNDGQVSICLNRTWTNDCDVNLTGSPQALKIPLKGSCRVPVFFTIDEQAVQERTVTSHPREYIKLQLSQKGGACEPDYRFDMTDFWKGVTVSKDKRSISWDFTGTNAIDFGSACRLAQDEVDFHVNLVVPTKKFGFPSKFSAFITTRRLKFPTPFFKMFNPIKITNSCLATGTLIQLADSSEVAIEDISAGDQVFNEYHSKQAAAVVDTAFGFETNPMVRIESESGRALMMTDMHPVITVEDGVTLARDLQVGDLVATVDGVEKLTQVTRVAYGGNVHNLKLASQPGKTPGADNTVYANGFMVGDGTMQAHYEKLDRTRTGNVLDRIPAAWHDDYRNVKR